MMNDSSCSAWPQVTIAIVDVGIVMRFEHGCKLRDAIFRDWKMHRHRATVSSFLAVAFHTIGVREQIFAPGSTL